MIWAAVIAVPAIVMMVLLTWLAARPVKAVRDPRDPRDRRDRRDPDVARRLESHMDYLDTLHRDQPSRRGGGS